MVTSIRKATIADAEIIALLAQITFRQAFNHYWNDENVLRNYFKQTFSVSKLRSSISKPNNVFWIAYADELPVGYAKLKLNCPNDGLNDPTPAQLQKIYILNDYIAQGIGEKLQNELFEEVKSNKIKTLWLAVWDQNDKAIKFYERHGFSTETTHHYDFEKMSIDYLVMTKYF